MTAIRILPALVAAAILACAGTAGAQDTVKIGVITDRVASAKFYAEPVSRGVELGAKVINEKGGILGKKIELIVEDDQNKPDVSAAKARKLVDDGVIAIVSNTGSPATQQAQTVSLETKTPHLTPANSADFLTTQLDNPYFFQTGPLASIQLGTLMAYTKSRGFKQVAIVRDNSALSQSFADSFKQGLEKAGIKVALEEVIPQGATSAVATRLLIVPMPSTVRVTTSPGTSGGSSSRDAPRPHSSPRQPPLPQVPDPSTSPGRTTVPREA